jgi:hypothetical protein
MPSHAQDTKQIVLTVVAVLVGIALIAVGVFMRESIGSFASFLVISVGIVVALLIPALGLRRRNRTSH